MKVTIELSEVDIFDIDEEIVKIAAAAIRTGTFQSPLYGHCAEFADQLLDGLRRAVEARTKP